MKIWIEGMRCTHCVAHVTEALTSIGLTNIRIQLAKGLAEADGKAAPQAIRSAIEDAGYDVLNIVEEN